MRDIFNGALVAFECLGDIRVNGHRFLDAITVEGRVKLSQSFAPPFTGARWQCMSLGDGSFALVSAAAAQGFRYLDGNTQNGIVRTVGDTLPPFSGTHWRVHELSPGVVTIQCLGDFLNPNHQYLDGSTQDGEIGLAPSTNPPFSGTRWGTIALPRSSIAVHTQRESIRSKLTIWGKNFTPNDQVRFDAEGIVGRANHAAFPLRGFVVADGNGAFDAFPEVDFFPAQPLDVPVIIRATDTHGRTASALSDGFHS